MRFPLRLAAWFLLGVPAVAAAACTGNLDGATGTPTTLATIHGEMTNLASVPITSNVRIAVIWGDNGDGDFSVSEDLPVQPVFPSQFQVALDGPPPADALIPWGGSPTATTAIGVVVAYEDVNGNGKLDLVTNEAGAFVDRIIGVNQDLTLMYLAVADPTTNAEPDPLGRSPVVGYNLEQTTPECGALGREADGGPLFEFLDGGGCTPWQWLSITSPYDLPLSSDPQINGLMCTGGFQDNHTPWGPDVSWDVSEQGIPPGGFPAPDTDNLDCNDTTDYTALICTTTSNGLCSETTACAMWNVELGDAGAPPGWPCSGWTPPG